MHGLRQLRAGDGEHPPSRRPRESLTKCDDAQLIETIDNLRADLHHRGCKMILVKVPGHAREEFGIEANTQQAYADATAKAAAHLTTHVDPPLTVKRGPHILAAQEDPNHTGTDPNTGFSTIGTGTRTSKWVARGVQSTLTLKAIRRDDATHDATTGRSAIDRIITGADPKLAPAPSSQPKALPLHPTARHPACTAQTHSPTSTPSMRLNLPSDTRVWRELIEDACSGHNVRRPLDDQPGGFAWLGQTMGGGHITFRCHNCPACGHRADARHILTNECTYFKIPENVRNMLRHSYCATESAKRR